MNSLVLSGGGAKGSYEAGILYEIFENIEFQKIYGTSVGALNSVLMAQCYIDKSRERLKKVWLKKIKKDKDVYYKNYVKAIWGGCPYSFAPLRSLVESEIDFDKILSMDEEVVITSVDLVSGKTIYFSNHETKDPEIMYNAVIASASIPPAFNPVTIGNYRLVDGGVRDNVPTKFLIDSNESDSALIILCGENETERKEGEYNGIIEIGSRSIDIMTSEIAQNDVNMILRINDLLKNVPTDAQGDWLSNKKIINIDVIYPKTKLGNVLDFKHEELAKSFAIGIGEGIQYLNNK